jgi:MYXO-CTERM domain-containing protein
MPDEEPDPYAVLGVARTATEQELRTAYRELVARYHPDRHQGNPLKDLASAKLAEINRAYAILSDPARRAAYDAGRSAAWQAPRSQAPGAPRWAGPGYGKFIALLLALPFILRLGIPLVRMLAILLRSLFEAASVLEGTPFVAVAVLLALVGLGVAWFRRRRPKA